MLLSSIMDCGNGSSWIVAIDHRGLPEKVPEKKKKKKKKNVHQTQALSSRHSQA
jgi:hypothetical protein